MRKTAIMNLLVTAIILAASLAPVVTNGMPETKRSQVVFLVGTFIQSVESLAKGVLPFKKADKNSDEENSPSICGIRG